MAASNWTSEAGKMQLCLSEKRAFALSRLAFSLSGAYRSLRWLNNGENSDEGATPPQSPGRGERLKAMSDKDMLAVVAEGIALEAAAVMLEEGSSDKSPCQRNRQRPMHRSASSRRARGTKAKWRASICVNQCTQSVAHVHTYAGRACFEDRR